MCGPPELHEMLQGTAQDGSQISSRRFGGAAGAWAGKDEGS